jgi:hypothetical protein
MDSIMGKARDEKAQGFTPPALDTFTPPELRDDVERVVAAGMKILYGNDMREEVQQELARNVPMAQKLGEAVVGLLLTLDQQSRGGIPEAVLAPAAQALLGEAAEIAQAAGQPVTEEEFKDASIVAFQTLGRKLGYSEDQMMQAVGGGADEAEDDGQEPAGLEQPEDEPVEEEMDDAPTR